MYTVIVSLKSSCSKATESDQLTITTEGHKARLYEGGHLCATTGTVYLSATGVTNVHYQWYRNSQSLAGRTLDTLSTSQPGRYWAAVLDPTGCVVNSDTALIERSAAVQALLLTSSGQNRICPQSTLTLQASGGLAYRWQKDGITLTNQADQYVATTAGTYALTATDGFGCAGLASVSITQLPTVSPILDSIPGVCGTTVADRLLRGSPSGGVFAGDGVQNNVFSARQAGVGNHVITYTIRAAPECAGVVATQTAVVAPIPSIDLPDTLTTYKGNTLTLNPHYTGNPTHYQWASATYLDNPEAANPTINNIEKDITYTLQVVNSTGCQASDTIRIRVVDRIWVPDAFSPNGDGLNDVWSLPGIEAFPDAIVTIFNRWGDVIYASSKGYHTPFDGTLHGTSLPSGTYAYTLWTVPERPIMRGSLLLIR